MTLGELLDRLDGVTKTSKGFAARCPAHADKGPSLSVKQGERWILTHCYAGCSTDEICSALGIKTTDLAVEPPKPVGERFGYETEMLFVDLHRPAPTGIERIKLIAKMAKLAGEDRKEGCFAPARNGKS